MTDDNNPRYRPRDPIDHGSEPANVDPLAELARLIGRNDLYPDHEREPHAAPPREPHYADELHSQYDWHAETATAPDAAYDEPVPADAPSRPYVPEPQYEPHAYEPAPRSQPAWSVDEPYRSTQYRRNDPPPLADFGTPGFHGDETTRETLNPGPMPPHVDDPLLEEPPERSRSRGVATLLIVLAIAAIGSGAAFAYRTYFSFPDASKPAPIIRASSEPTKVTPPAPSSDTPANKLSYDRFGDRSKNEQVVLREEKPVDPKNLVTATTPEPAMPAPPAAPSPTTTPVGAVPPAVFPPVAPPAAAQANPPSVLTEPKRIRTVTVRPDQPDPASQPQTLGTTPNRRPPAAVTAPPPSAPANPPEIAQEPTPRAATRAPTRSTAPSALAQNSPANNPNAPLSLAPDSPSTAPTRPVRTAAPPRTASTPTATAAPAASKTGSYLVQVASQKSEADAQTAFRSVKSKYSGVLGDREPTIRRADLGAKGVYYRAMVGPFSSREQAIQMCASLKSAGGDCVVQSN